MAECFDIRENEEEDIPEVNLFEVLQLLPLIFENMSLQMQARNIAVTDLDLNRMEDQLLALYLEREHTPVPEIFVVSAWSQMWIFAFFELIRTWKSHADCMLRFIRKLQRIAPDKRLEAIDDEERRLNLAPRTLSPAHSMFTSFGATWQTSRRPSRNLQRQSSLLTRIAKYLQKSEHLSGSIRCPIPGLLLPHPVTVAYPAVVALCHGALSTKTIAKHSFPGVL